MRLSMISLGGIGASRKGRKAAESLLCKALPAAGASDIKLALKFALLLHYYIILAMLFRRNQTDFYFKATGRDQNGRIEK